MRRILMAAGLAASIATGAAAQDYPSRPIRVFTTSSAGGISDYAQKELGDVVFVELPQVGTQLEAGDELGSIESVKAVSELFAPVSGEVVEVNEALAAEPALVNSDAGGKAWFFKLKIADKSELGGLMDEAAYKAHTA